MEAVHLKIDDHLEVANTLSTNNMNNFNKIFNELNKLQKQFDEN